MRRKASLLALVSLGFATAALPFQALADAGGVGFWLPGIFGNLAATPTVPGWAYASIYLHLQANAGASQNFVTSSGARGSVVAGLNAHGDALALGITYVSPTPVLGGQATFSVVSRSPTIPAPAPSSADFGDVRSGSDLRSASSFPFPRTTKAI
ncbi:hypothetical protein [Bradyrhizobium sp. ORS 111]|uniref:hypothetical protein n=1 Tax=Bradyrhizobium sp. ORS 111 TaxID=1685958 RepID=UPI003890B83B